MVSWGNLGGVAQALSDARTFETAAGVVLKSIVEGTAGVLASSPYATADARLLRAVVHLRPHDSYRRVYVLDLIGSLADGSSRPVGSDFRASSTCWRWVAERGCEVAIDVNLGAIELAGGERTATPGFSSNRFESDESRGRFLAREASHVLAMPLRVPGGNIAGMISLEADCRLAIGRPFIWQEVVSLVRPLVGLAGPYLASLPSDHPLVVGVDEHLPVIGRSMLEVVELLRTFAEQEETLLLTGPTGSGKSRLAHWCHERSSRRTGPLITLDLSTVPEDLQMAELFGWKKGAFTGAARDTRGAIGRADRGTLFIDEIDKLGLRAQAGLLRVLEEKRYRPLGEDAADRSASVRFIIGTNARLHELVKRGDLREDLYYRINVLPIAVPPLDERRDEVPAWANYMIRRRHQASGQAGVAGFEDAALAALQGRSWPGNLRQLDNVVRRAYTIALIRLGSDAAAVEVTLRDVDRAVALESVNMRLPLIEMVELAAKAFVSEVEHRHETGKDLDLDLVGALRGLVLLEAADRTGSREEAFRMLGREAVVSNRNHVKTFRQEVRRVEALYAALGETPPARWLHWFDDERE